MPDGWVWFDFENTPHVLFLEPLVRGVQKAGWPVGISAKPQAQTLDLARLRGFEVEPVGSGDFIGIKEKIFGGLTRARALRRWARARPGRPRLFVSSSRSGSVAAWLTGVSGVGLLDYEHAEQRTLGLGPVIWFPDLLRDAPLPRRSRRIARFYPGLKENLYIDTWPVDRARLREELDVDADTYLVVARPPAESAHYAGRTVADSTRLWLSTIRALAVMPQTRILVVARTARQGRSIVSEIEGLDRVVLLDRVVHGPDLVAAADLVLGGGGTMNREAAALGVPAWSTFCGPSPIIDERLAGEGRLRWIRSDEQLTAALRDPLPGRTEPRGPFPAGREAILTDVLERLAVETGR